MPAAPPSRSRSLRRAGAAFLGLGLGVLAATWIAILGFSEEVRILVRRHGPAEEAEARALRDPRDDVAEIYGVPEGRPLVVVFPDPARRIVPAEAPGVVLLHVDRLAGEAPLLARALAPAGSAGGLLLVASGFLALALARRGTRPHPDPAR